MRTKNKIFRLTDLQLEQLETYLKLEQVTFTDFIHGLIQREIMKNAVTVQSPHDQEPPIKVRTKTVLEIVKRYQHTDPALLLELSRIGNNINQIARGLNVLKNADPAEQRQVNIFECLRVLKSIQTDLAELSPALPKITRQPPDRLQKQLSSLDLVGENESAY